VKLDLALDHILLATPNLGHIDSHCFGKCAEVGSIPGEVRDSGPPDFILGWQAGHCWARATNPLALDHSHSLARPGQMPGKPFATLAASENDDIEGFMLRHGNPSFEDMVRAPKGCTSRTQRERNSRMAAPTSAARVSGAK
jgi:hypothetical protein